LTTPDQTERQVDRHQTAAPQHRPGYLVTRRGAALFALMSVVWGLPYYFIKIGVRHLSPAMIVEGRTAIAAIVLLPFAIREGRMRGLIAAAWKPLLAYTVVEIAVPWYLLSNAERRLPSSLSGLLVAAVPLISVILVALTGHADRMDRRGIGGLVVGLVGVGVLLGLDVSPGDLGSVAQVGVVAVCYAIGPLVAARYFADESSLALSAVSLTLVAVAYLAPAILTRPGQIPPGSAIASIVALGLVCTALAFVAFFELIKEMGPTRATVITYVNPAVAVILGVALLGEQFTVATGVGFALILVGCWVSTGPRREAAAAPV
jgi:drug/metabolite transporter (DMT)-like permease